jgi:hypothetical protein
MGKFMLSDLQKADMVGFFPFNPGAVYEFEPEAYKVKKDDGKRFFPDSIIPKVKIKAFNKPDRDQARKIHIDLASDHKSVARETVMELARKYTVGWSNLPDISAGDEYSFKAAPDGGADKDVFDGLPEGLLVAIFYRLCAISGLSGSAKAGLGY